MCVCVPGKVYIQSESGVAEEEEEEEIFLVMRVGGRGGKGLGWCV